MGELVIPTSGGLVRGEARGDVRVWKGIPYAAPPVGPLRFRPPAPAVPWAGERDATRYGRVAAQSRDPRVAMLSGIPATFESGEDALTVNVFAPAAPGPHPVLVWIHGGAFVFGSGSTPLYDGARFARQGLVVVTLNYRLGLPGFLYLGDLAPGRDAGNYALLDQIAALAWVRDNVAAFGGDPAQVTVMGESAGAMSITHLLTMPAARGLFHRAVLESGGTQLSPPTRDDATRLARRTLAALACTVAELDDVPLDRVLRVQDQLAQELGLGAFAPYVDGVTVPVAPIEALRAGCAAHLPVLAGSNRDEWTLFHVFLGDATVDPLKPALRERLGAGLDRLLALYRAAEPGRSEQRAWVDLVGDLVFRVPMLRLAEAQLAHGAPTYVYRFDWRSPALGGQFGAAHAFELPFVWNRLDLPMSILLGDDASSAQPLATQMHDAFARFVRTGDPNGPGLPSWPRYDTATRPTLLFDRETRLASDPSGETRALWASLWPT